MIKGEIFNLKLNQSKCKVNKFKFHWSKSLKEYKTKVKIEESKSTNFKDKSLQKIIKLQN